MRTSSEAEPLETFFGRIPKDTTWTDQAVSIPLRSHTWVIRTGTTHVLFLPELWTLRREFCHGNPYRV